MDLRTQVLQYYLDNFSALQTADQFHFATRMSAWLGLPQGLELLQTMRPQIVPAEETNRALMKQLDCLVGTDFTAQVNAPGLRAPYFAKYPRLRGVELALFRVHWLQAVYEIDAREALLDIVDEELLQSLEKTLMPDEEALKALSTYAINYIYLLHTDVFRDDDIPRENLYEIGATYDTTDPQQLQLLIYFYTHCILCEARFYTATVSPEYRTLYHRMLQRLETEIDQHFDAIHLDNKLEFLVCCRIGGFDTKLTTRIEAECAQSVSDDGTFLIDRHNSSPQTHRQTFETSEHRNVLFIMSGSAYDPHSIAV